MRSRPAYIAYLVTASLFSGGILVQVFLVGLSLLGGRPSWGTRRGLGHGLGVLALLMIILAYVGRLPRPMKPPIWLNFAIYFVLADIVIFQRDSAPVITALHPVVAVILFPAAGTLAVLIGRIGRTSQAETAAVPNKPVTSSTAG